MRSWLYTPAVQFLSLIASLVALGQFAASACKHLSAILRADHEHRRVYNAAALAALVALAICAPLAWSADIQAYDGHMDGTPGGALFPLMMTLTCVLGSTLLCLDASFPKDRRPVGPLWPGCLIVLGLGTIAGMRFGVASMPPVWEFYVLIGFPGLVIAIYMLALVLEGVDQIRVARADPVWRKIRELKRRARTSL
jgi:hypothetical protein